MSAGQIVSDTCYSVLTLLFIIPTYKITNHANSELRFLVALGPFGDDKWGESCSNICMKGLVLTQV